MEAKFTYLVTKNLSIVICEVINVVSIFLLFRI
jgi:hypothetical protein